MMQFTWRSTKRIQSYIFDRVRKFGKHTVQLQLSNARLFRHSCDFQQKCRSQNISFPFFVYSEICSGRRGRDRWQLDLQLHVQSVPIAINVVSSNTTNGKMHTIQHYVIKFVSDCRHAISFLRVLGFLPLMKLTATI